MNSRRIKGSVLTLIAMGAIFVGTSGQTAFKCEGGSAGNSQRSERHINEDKVDYWCRTVDPNDPDTYVYKYFDRTTGRTGYIRGTGDAGIWRKTHKGGWIKAYCTRRAK